ncbi:uncharacterized protein LOC143905883 [Temnothorax americanus]|uniref:uncharacterized protein LOC143905883 n=1 Tax=Temnothorax americanus TaxID=1964332 RepID=UPI004068B14D
MVKVEWFCIVPGCKSNSKDPGHFFPKNPTLSQKWKEIVNNSIIFNTSSEDLRKYRVCHLHFLPEDYIYSVNRRILKHNAVPSLNICNAQTVNTEVNDINTTEQHSQSETSITEIHLEFEANTTDNELHLQSQTSHECNETSTNTTELHLESEANTTDNELHSQSQTSHECNETSTSTTELYLESETNTTDNELHSQSQNSHEFNMKLLQVILYVQKQVRYKTIKIISQIKKLIVPVLPVHQVPQEIYLVLLQDNAI